VASEQLVPSALSEVAVFDADADGQLLLC